ncbi:hypothetical protein CF327_g5889 [Tilletia walkeri]|uniref:Uncharacterized protein n=1 Tax=Tilletia walkeri TaxID=117179 RepID=A0A8X7N8K8_9BASI|nr:hypothetical protein CF327_g5889 [Tilletia walkeri]KAE8267505.1 hypothetical protein A4X09_0g4841 [Tilletia walkeri]
MGSPFQNGSDAMHDYLMSPPQGLPPLTPEPDNSFEWLVHSLTTITPSLSLPASLPLVALSPDVPIPLTTPPMTPMATVSPSSSRSRRQRSTVSKAGTSAPMPPAVSPSDVRAMQNRRKAMLYNRRVQMQREALSIITNHFLRSIGTSTVEGCSDDGTEQVVAILNESNASAVNIEEGGRGRRTRSTSKAQSGSSNSRLDSNSRKRMSKQNLRKIELRNLAAVRSMASQLLNRMTCPPPTSSPAMNVAPVVIQTQTSQASLLSTAATLPGSTIRTMLDAFTSHRWTWEHLRAIEQRYLGPTDAKDSSLSTQAVLHTNETHVSPVLKLLDLLELGHPWVYQASTGVM